MEDIKGRQGEGEISFLVGEILMEIVTITENVKCKETIWLRIEIVSDVDLYVGCAYMPTQGNIKHLCSDS